MPRYLLLFLFPLALSGQQLTFATYQGGAGAESVAGIARDAQGNVYLAGISDSTDNSATADTGGSFLVKFDANGKKLATMPLPSFTVTAIAVDNSAATSTVVVAGTVLNLRIGLNTNTTAVVARIDSALTQTQWTAGLSATPNAIALDASGNVYVTGVAQSAFTTTAGVYQPALKGVSNAFVLKLSADGATTLYATFLGGSNADSANAIAVDASGNAYLTGVTTSSDFPLAHAAQSEFGGLLQYFSDVYGDAFVAKLDPKGASLLYSTYLGGAAADAGYAIALDSTGNAYIAGATQSPTWLAGAAKGTFQTAYAGPTADPDSPSPTGDGFVAKLSSTGALAWYSYLGGAGGDEARAIALDNTGNIYVAGNQDSTDFPRAGTPAPDCHIGSRPFLAEFTPSGAKLLSVTGLSGMGFDQAYFMTFDAARNSAYIAGDAQSVVFFATPGAAQPAYGGGDDDGFVARVDMALPPTLQVSCVLNGASFLAGNAAPYPTGAVAPGEIVSLFGVGLGPAAGTGLQLTGAGNVATSIGGMTVLFDSIPAPLLYAANGQINAVVPYGINAKSTSMSVQTGSSTLGPIVMPVVAAVPAIFMCGAACKDVSQAAAVNYSDSDYNMVSDPAPRGSIVTFYLEGAGMVSGGADGSVTPLNGPYPTPQLPVTVTIRGVTAQTQFIGAAPGYVNGLLQINAYVPTSIDFGDHVPLSVSVGSFSTQNNVTLAVK